MRDSRKAALMSGTAKFSAGSGVAFGNGRWDRASRPQRPLVRAWRWVCRSVLRSGRGIALDASGPAQLAGGRARRLAALMLLAITGAAVARCDMRLLVLLTVEAVAGRAGDW